MGSLQPILLYFRSAAANARGHLVGKISVHRMPGAQRIMRVVTVAFTDVVLCCAGCRG